MSTSRALTSIEREENQKMDTQHDWEMILHYARIFYIHTFTEKGCNKSVDSVFSLFNVLSLLDPPYILKHLTSAVSSDTLRNFPGHVELPPLVSRT